MKHLIIIELLILALLIGARTSAEHRAVIAQHDTVYYETEWSRLVSALIKVESNGNDKAVNATSGARGCLQIMPIYVREANRLLSEERYTFDDAFDRSLSLEMFEVIQNHYNPDRDIYKAIKLHNPNGGERYRNKVLNAMEE